MLILQQQLAEARHAYHMLNTGRMARVFVDQNGERVEFTAATRTGLYNYIMQLESQVCPQTDLRPSNGPAGFFF
jgi:putative alpha-1,2-mannosidase